MNALRGSGRTPALSRRAWLRDSTARGVAWSLLASVAAACGDSPRRAELEPIRWRPVDELNIGSAFDSAMAFGVVGSITVADDGTIYSAHPDEGEVRVWSRDGQPVRTLGRPGAGPGEFLGLGAIGLHGDTLWAIDGRAWRVTHFDPGGEVLRTVQLPGDSRAPVSDPTSGPARPRHILSDGGFYAVQSAVLPQVAGLDSTVVRHLNLAPDLRLRNTVHTVAQLPRNTLAIQAPGGGWTTYPQPFSDADLVHFSPDRGELLVVDRTLPRRGAGDLVGIRVLSIAGDVVLDRRVPFEPVALEPETGARIRRNVVLALRRELPGIDPTELEARVREELFVPQTYPPVTAAVLGSDGSIWLRAGAGEGGKVDWTILSPAGDPLGVVNLPGALAILAARSDRVWGVQHSALGVPYLRRIRLEEQ